MELAVSRIARSSPAQPPTSGTAGAEHAVGAADDLLLVAGEAVGEQEQHAVRTRVERVQAARDLGARLAQPLRGACRPRC